MKIQIIICQNPFVCGSPKEDRRVANLKDHDEYHYVCREVDKNFNQHGLQQDDNFDGFTYRDDVFFTIPDIEKKYKETFLDQLAVQANAQKKYLTRQDLSFLLFKLVKENQIHLENPSANTIFNQPKTEDTSQQFSSKSIKLNR